MELFITEPTLEFERAKTASVQLDEDPSMWPKEILAELFRQVPEASEYVPRVIMYQVDEEQGYGFGAVVIAASTDSALSVSSGGAPTKQALVPVIVKGHMLQPLDLLLTTKNMRPLTASRLREALFRPNTFDVMTNDWGDQSLYNLFYPPGRSENDFAAGVSQTASGGAGGAIRGAGMKYASAEATILEATILDVVAPTISRPWLEKLSEDIASSPALRHRLVENEYFRSAVAKLAAHEAYAVSDAAPLFRTAEGLFDTHVAQMGYDEDRDQYWVKAASRNYAKHPTKEFMDRKAFMKLAGEDGAVKVDTEGTVTVSQAVQEAVPFNMDASEWALVKHPGVYRVQTTAGKELLGWVMPNLIDMHGVRVPLAAFTNGAVAAVQDEIVGSWVGSGHSIPQDTPHGTGVFYMKSPGGMDATVPVEVFGQEADMDGSESYHVRDYSGMEYKIKLVPGLRKMMAATDESNVVLMPDAARFMRIDQESPVELQKEPAALVKMAQFMAGPQIRVWSDGERYGMELTRLPKLAQLIATDNATRDETMFALAFAGVSPQDAVDAIEKAASLREPTTFVGVQDVRLAAELVGPALTAGQEMAKFASSLRRDLLKEAAMLPDVQTVDSVLSLGFINPENVRMYVAHLPKLDRALTMVSELTLAARLGLTEIPEFAASRAARALNEVIEGLKALALRKVDENAA